MEIIPKFYVGLDLHKTLIQACVLNFAGEVVDEIKVRIRDRVAGELLIDSLTPYFATGSCHRE